MHLVVKQRGLRELPGSTQLTRLSLYPDQGQWTRHHQTSAHPGTCTILASAGVLEEEARFLLSAGQRVRVCVCVCGFKCTLMEEPELKKTGWWQGRLGRTGGRDLAVREKRRGVFEQAGDVQGWTVGVEGWASMGC